MLGRWTEVQTHALPISDSYNCKYIGNDGKLKRYSSQCCHSMARYPSEEIPKVA